MTTRTATATEIASSVLDRLEAAWNRGDGAGYGAAYADNAAFVNVNGLAMRGRAAIAGGHAGIFGTIYRDSQVRYQLVEALEWADGVVHVVARGTLDVPQGPLAGVRDAIGTHLLVRVGDDWQIAATQNTLVEA